MKMLALIIAFISSTSFAAPKLTECADTLACVASGNCLKPVEWKDGKSPDIILRGSGQDHDMQAQLAKDKETIYGIARALGQNIPDMVITHAANRDMAALAANNGHGVGLWVDGARIWEAYTELMGVLEFVTPGAYHQQYVRDTNSLFETRMVYAHVAGHSDFFENSPMFKVRHLDQIKNSLALAQYVSQLKQTVHYAEISEYYHFLQTISPLQDMARGTFTAPGQLVQEAGTVTPKLVDGKLVFEQPPNPKAPTQSVLQAYVANPPTGLAPWKVEMARLFERVHRWSSGAVQTKTMNEGWAIMSQYLILRHSPWNDKDLDAPHFAHINSGVAFPKLSNPYWVGFEAWKRLREKFNERPEISSLTDEFEKDKKFVAYAHEIIAQYTDYSFLRMALDAKWVEKYNLLLTRDEMVKGEQLIKVATRDPQLVVNQLSRMSNADLHFPKISLVDLNHQNLGYALLRHEPAYAIPLERTNIGPALYVLSQLFQRAVRLETIWSGAWLPRTSSSTPFDTGKLTITMTYDGKVAVTAEGQPELAEQLQKDFQGFTNFFREDSALSYEPDRMPALPSSLQVVTENKALQGTEVIRGQIRHSPTGSEAVIDYLRLMEKRRLNQLKLAVIGKAPIEFGENTVRIRVLPMTPILKLDHSVLEKRKDWLVNPPPSSSFPFTFMARQLPPEALEGEDLDIGAGPQLPGEVIGKRDKNGGGGGQGQQGDGDGEPQPGEGQGSKSGKGGGDPAYEELPLEVYGELLAQAVELRNLRHTKGASEKKDDILQGSEHRPFGDVLWDRTAAEALKIGRALDWARQRKLKPEERKKTKVADLIKLGMRNMSPADQVVRSREPDMEPDFDAVIVLAADTSGSMGEEHRRIEKLAYKNILALLKHVYPKIKVHFVVYADEAKEVNEKEFFTLNMSGGTNTTAAFDKIKEILGKYSRSRYNRFAQIFTDGDDGDNNKALAAALTLAPMTEYLAYGNVHPQGMEGGLSKEFVTLSTQEPDKIGYANLTSSPESIFEAIKTYFGKKAK